MYALHETLEVHELAAFKVIGMTKAKLMQGLVSDSALKNILQQDVEISTRQLQELGAILAKASEQEMKV